MQEIAALLAELKEEGDERIAAIHDRSLPWGAAVSDYGDSIEKARSAGLAPVVVELAEDRPLPAGTISIDHHGERGAEPSALAQVFALLALPAERWTRRMALVDANDRGHIAAMRAMGATEAEVEEIRAQDRRAQGITAEEEAEGLAAIATRREALAGSLVIVDLPHERTATVADPLALCGERRDLLIHCPRSTHFFGSGARITRLNAAFPGGWLGGQLPLRGYWGVAQPLQPEAVVDTLT